jgi:hypothetical protein
MESVTKKIRTPDGRVLEIKGPADAPDEMFFRYAASQIADEAAPIEPETSDFESRIEAIREEGRQRRKAKQREDAGFFDNVFSGFGAGAVGMGETAALGAATLMDEEEELAARESIQGIAESIRPEGGDPESIPYQVSAGLGSIVGLAAPAGVAALGAAALAPAAFAGLAASLASGTVLGGLGYGAARGIASERARDAGVSEEARDEAIGSKEVLLAGAIEGIPLLRPLKFLRVPGVDKLIEKLGDNPIDGANFLKRIEQRLVSAGKTGVIEGAQEAASAILQNLAERGYNPERELVDTGVLEEAAIGGTAGGIFQALVDVFTKGKSRGPTGDAPLTDTGEEATAPAATLADTDTLEETTPETVTPEKPIVQTATENAVAEDPTLGQVKPEAVAQEDFDMLVGQARKDVEESDGVVLDKIEKTYENIRNNLGGESANVYMGAVDTLVAKTLEARKAVPVTPATPEAQEAAPVTPEAQEVAPVTLEAQEAAPVEAAPPAAPDTPRGDATGRSPEQQAKLARILKAASAGKSYEETFADIDAINAETAVEPVVEPEAGVVEETKAKRRAEEFRRRLVEAKTPVDRINAAVSMITVGKNGGNQQLIDEGQAALDAAEAEGYTIQEGTRKGDTRIVNALEREGSTRIISFEEGDPTDGNIETIERVQKVGILKDGKLIQVSDASVSYKPPTNAKTTAAKEAAPKKATPKKAAKKPTTEGRKVLKLPKGMTTKKVYTTAWANRNKDPEVRAAASQMSEDTEDVSTAKDRNTVLEKINTKGKRSKKGSALSDKDTVANAELNAIKIYFGRYPTISAALRIAAFDAVFSPQYIRNQKETEEAGKYLGIPPEDTFTATETALFKGMGSKNAALVIAWAKANLSDSTKKQLETVERANLVWLNNLTNTTNNRVTANLYNESVDADIAVNLEASVKDMFGPNATTQDINTTLDEDSDIATYEATAAAIGEALTTKEKSDIQAQQAREDLIAKIALEGTGNLPNNKKIAAAEKTFLDAVTKMIQSSEKIKAEELAAAIRDYLKVSAISNLDVPVHPEVIAALEAGDIKDALRRLGNSLINEQLAGMATKLSSAMGDVKVVFKTDLKDADGEPVAGSFDSTTNTITLDSQLGLTAHPIMHEASHALTSNTLDNKSHPLTKKLQTLFDDAKQALPEAYGFGSLKEFVAEVFSNPEFQKKLAKVNIKGKTLWERFYNAVVNFLRSKLGLDVRANVMFRENTRPQDSALTEADQLISAILATNSETRGEGEIDNAASHDDLAPIAEGAGVKIPPRDRAAITKAQSDRLSETLSLSLPAWFKSAILGNAPLLNLTMEAKRVGLKSAPRLNNIVNEMAGSVGKLLDKANYTAKPMMDYFQNNTQEYRIFSDVNNRATLFEVDPTLNRVEAAAKYKKTGVKRTAKSKSGETTKKISEPNIRAFTQWEQVHADYKKLSPEAQQYYKTIRNTYRSFFDSLMSALKTRLDGTIADSKVSGKVYKRLYDELFDSGMIDPFSPLVREGEFWLTYHALDPITGQQEYFVESFVSNRARAAARLELEEIFAEDGWTKAEFKQEESVTIQNYRSAPDGSFVNLILKSLSDNQSSFNSTADYNAVTDNIVKLFADTLPQTSLVKGLQNRKGRRGFIGDITPREAKRRKDAIAKGTFAPPKHDPVFVMLQRGNSFARQIIQLQYAPEITKLSEQLEIEARANGNVAASIAVELKKRADFIRNPNVERWASFLTSLGFNMTLGGNMSSALIQTAALPTVVYGHLGGRYGFTEALKVMGEATKIFSMSGLTRTVEVFGPEGDGTYLVKGALGAPHALSNFDFDNKQLKKDHPEIAMLKVLSRVAEANAMTQRSQIQEAIELEAAPDSDPKFLGLVSIPRKLSMRSLNQYTAFMFSYSERMVRTVTLISAYKLHLKRLAAQGKDPRLESVQIEAAEESIFITELTNSSIATGSAPRWAQKHIGKVMYLFTRYGLSMTSLFAQLGRDSVKGDPSLSDKENEQLKLEARKQFGAIYLSSFLFAGAAGVPGYGIISMFMDMLFDDDEETMDTRVRQTLGEAGYGGVINYFTGLDVSTRIGLSDLIFRDSFIQKDESVFWKLATLAGGPVGGLALQTERGINYINEGYVYKGVETMLPASLRNMAKAARIADAGGIATKREDFIIEDLHAGELAGQFFGFMPVRYSFELQKNAQKKQITKALTSQTKNLTGRYYLAIKNADMSALISVMEDIDKFNKRNPKAFIDSDTLKRSLRGSFQTTARMQAGTTYSKKYATLLADLESDYDESPVFVYD